jgi:hypothetical protein
VGDAGSLWNGDGGAAREEFDHKLESLSAAVTAALLARPDVERLVGPGNQEVMRTNHLHHGRFMSTLLLAFDGKELVDTVIWVLRAYRAHGFHLDYWPIQLSAWLEVMERELSGEALRGIAPIYHWMTDNMTALAALAEDAAGDE